MPKLTACLPRAALLAIALTAWPALAQAETFTAVAAIKTAAGESASVPVTVVVGRYATSEERRDLIAAIKKGGETSTHALLLKRETVGMLQIDGRWTPLRYAYAADTGGGRTLTLATAEPIPIANMKNQPGFDVGFLLLDLDASGSGTGDLVAAAKVHVDAQDAIVTEHASPEIVHLSNVTRK